MIYVDRRLRPYKSLLVLVHEVGHAVSFRRGFNPRAGSHHGAEARAYLYGWGVIVKWKLPITRARWRELNWEAFEPETE